VLEHDFDDTLGHFIEPYLTSLYKSPTCSRLPKDYGYGCVLYCLLEC